MKFLKLLVSSFASSNATDVDVHSNSSISISNTNIVGSINNTNIVGTELGMMKTEVMTQPSLFGTAYQNINNIFDETSTNMESYMTFFLDGLFSLTDNVAENLFETRTEVCSKVITPNLGNGDSIMATVIYDYVHLCPRPKTTLEIIIEYAKHAVGFAVDVSFELVDMTVDILKLCIGKARHLAWHWYGIMYHYTQTAITNMVSYIQTAITNMVSYIQTAITNMGSYIQTAITNIASSYNACITITMNGMSSLANSVNKMTAEVEGVGRQCVSYLVTNMTPFEASFLVSLCLVGLLRLIMHINEKHTKAKQAQRSELAAITIQRAFRNHLAKRDQAAKTIQRSARVFLKFMKKASEKRLEEVRYAYFKGVKMAQAEHIRKTVQIATFDDHEETDSEDGEVEIDERITKEKFEESCRILGLYILIDDHDALLPGEDDDATIKACFKHFLKGAKRDAKRQVVLKEAEQVLLEVNSSMAKKTEYEAYWAQENGADDEDKADDSWLVQHVLGVASTDVNDTDIVVAALEGQLQKVTSLSQSKLCDDTSPSYNKSFQIVTDFSLELMEDIETLILE